MNTLRFTVTFHSPFRVGAAAARDGVAAPIDHHLPLPGDHLKGLMRFAAGDILGLGKAQVADVFGGKGTRSVDARDRAAPCAWSWIAAVPAEPWTFRLRHRISIDGDTHTAREDHLVAGEQAWSPTAWFEVLQMDAVPADRLDWHRLVLRAAGAAVHNLGSWRRRGLGWVTIAPDEPLTGTEIASLMPAARHFPSEGHR